MLSKLSVIPRISKCFIPIRTKASFLLPQFLQDGLSTFSLDKIAKDGTNALSLLMIKQFLDSNNNEKNVLEKHPQDKELVKIARHLSFRSKSSSSKSKKGQQEYSEEVESGVNRQISAELNAGYAYLSMACYFGRTDVALPGCQGFFNKMYQEELDHAMFFINYQNMRGGQVVLCPVLPPEKQNWEGITKALATSVDMEKDVKQKLMDLFAVAEKHNDQSLMDVIAGQFLTEQDRSICEFDRLLTRACKMVVKNGVGEYLFDKEIMETFVKSKEGYK